MSKFPNFATLPFDLATLAPTPTGDPWQTPEGIADCARRIEAATGLLVHQFPKEREYFVEMRLEA